MGCLSTSETGSRTATELAQHIRISAATVSHAVKLMEEQGLLQRGRDADSRRQRYFINDGAGYRTVSASARANQHLAATALRSANTLGANTSAGLRLAAAAQFLEHIGTDIIRSAQHWRTAASMHSS